MDVSTVLSGLGDASVALQMIVVGLIAFASLIYVFGCVLNYVDRSSGSSLLQDQREVELRMAVDLSSGYYTEGELKELALDRIVSRDYDEARQVNAAIDSMGLGSNSSSSMSDEQKEWETLTTAAEREVFYVKHGMSVAEEAEHASWVADSRVVVNPFYDASASPYVEERS